MNIELFKLWFKWFTSNKLSLNASKTNFIPFGHKRIPCNTNMNLTLDGNLSERTAHTKFLGVYIDERLTWSHPLTISQIKYLEGKE